MWTGQAIDIPLHGAQRFEPRGIPLPMLAAMDVALGYVEHLGERRFDYALELARDTLGILAQKFDTAKASGQSTLVSFDPGKDANEVCESLAKNKVVVRTVPSRNWLRISLGFWNSSNDVERLMEALS